MIPCRWDQSKQKSAFQELKFDPQNPLVKTEISRILARGKNPVSSPDGLPLDSELDMMLLGYSETLTE